MCGDVGCKQPVQRPSFEKMMEMGIDVSMCGMCEMYGWHNMLGEWQTEEGWCKAKLREGNLGASLPKCDYFLKRREV